MHQKNGLNNHFSDVICPHRAIFVLALKIDNQIVSINSTKVFNHIINDFIFNLQRNVLAHSNSFLREMFINKKQQKKSMFSIKAKEKSIPRRSSII